VKALQLGLGPIGLETARLVLASGAMELVGAVDTAPGLAGRRLGELLGPSSDCVLSVEADLAAALAKCGPDIVLQTTGSRLSAVMEQIETAVEHRANVVSTTEELLYPHYRHPREAQRIDALARRQGVSVLGTGVNPGFAMDSLPLCLSGVCRRLESVTVRRVVDASTRRGPLQRKIGAGLTPAEFRQKVSRRELGHVGLVESLDLLAAGLKIDLEEREEAIDPVVTEHVIRTSHLTVEPGQVAGIHHVALGLSVGRTRLHLDLWMYVGAPDPVDEVSIEGDPPIRSRIEGGIAGDAATVAMVVNSAPRVVEADPGLKTVLDIPPARWSGGSA
jgi:4-hydroxy-tetrahydrodipicolinate reductase